MKITLVTDLAALFILRKKKKHFMTSIQFVGAAPHPAATGGSKEAGRRRGCVEINVIL